MIELRQSAPWFVFEQNWVTFDTDKGRAEYAHVVRAAAIAWPVCRPLVVTLPRTVESLYGRLLADLPGVSLTAGIQSAETAKALDDIAGWRTVADGVRRACELTGEAICWLGSESLYRHAFKAGLRNRDFVRALRTLPRDVRILWYPSLGWGLLDQYRKAVAWARMVRNELPQGAFVSTALAYPFLVGTPSVRRDAMTGPRVYYANIRDEGSSWTAAQALRTHDIIYTRNSRAVQTAIEIGQAVGGNV